MDQLLFKYFRGEATSEEKQLIGRWLDDNPVENARQYKSARFIFEGITLHSDGRSEGARVRNIRVLRRMVRYAAGIAAAAVLTIGTGYLMQQRTLDTLAKQTASLEIPAGQRINITLPDGSNVWLNSGTRLDYPAVFAKGERRVKLSGEAMFEVVHDSRQPFIVETFASDVEVLGTKFNVLADPVSVKFTTTLLDGSVQIVNRLGEQLPVILRPGEVADMVGEMLTVTALDDVSSLCWIDGDVSIKGADFGELMAKFEKAYGVKIVIARENIPTIDYTRGKVRISDGIDHAMLILQHASDFSYERDEESGVIVIR